MINHSIPPSNEIFEEIKKLAILLWNTFSDEHGYRSGKINSIKDLANIGDNAEHIVAMFHHNLHEWFIRGLSQPAQDWLRPRVEEYHNALKNL